MNLHRMRKCCAVLMMLGVGAAQAQSFPTRPLRVVAPFTAGSTVDIMARVVSAKLSDVIGQQVLVENRVGAGGAVGIEAVARAPKDGYTMVLTASGLAIIPGLNPNLSWDPVKDFAPISQVATGPLIIVVNNDVPAKTLKELVALAKAKPGSLRYGHSGVGSTQHMAGQLLNVAAGINLGDVPYKGNEEALADLLAGRLEMNFQGIPSIISQIRAGKIRTIAVTSQKRSAVVPDVPTVAEAGFPDATASVWFGLLAPAGTPRPVVDKLSQSVVTVMKSQDVIDALAKGGSEAVSSTPDEFARLIREEVATWAKVIKQRGIKLE